jgi:hypothetical protein
MNTKGKCMNSECPRFGIEETYPGLLLVGMSAGRDRVRCPQCGELLKTTETVKTKGRRHVRPVTPGRKPQRDHDRGQRGR